MPVGRATARAAPDGAWPPLLRALLADTDGRRCARLVIEWIAHYHGLGPAICLVLDAGECLTALDSSHPEDWQSEPIDVESDHPLALALSSVEPVPFGPGRGRNRRPTPVDTPFGADAFVALPLGAGGDGDQAIGLLLLAAPPSLPADVLLATDLLGMRLSALDRREAHVRRAHLEAERDLLQNVIDAVPDPLVLTDDHARMRVTNRRAERLFFSEETDSEGRRRAVALNNMIFSASQFTHADGTSLRREIPLVDPTEGRDLLFEVLSTPLRDVHESGVLAVLHDVTDLRRATEETQASLRHLRSAEADARAERDRLDLIINSVADPVLVTDPTGNVVLLNPPAENLFRDGQGLSDESVRRLRRNEAVLSSFLSNLYTSRSERFSDELSLVDLGSGDTVPVKATAGRVLAGRGEVTAAVTILHDMTEAIEKARLFEQVKRHSEELKGRVEEATAELAEQNETLRRQAVALEQASALKTRFLANMSHELRTPLHAIMGYTSLLGRKGKPLDARQRRHLERIDSNAGHLLAIITDLLDIARIESGKMPLKVETFALPDLVAEVMGEMAPLIERSGLDVGSHIPPRLGRLSTDRQKMKQILVNLLSNALKFTHEGEVRLVAHSAGKGRLRVDLHDTGIGISPEDLRVIFDDFRQADASYTRAYGGTGLGLSISRRLVEMLGGRISAESTVGRGSTFTLLLPRVAR